ncbi:MAG: hypothetical protein JNK92_02945 [Dechloromonas sp.]|nr:hypothetical protein [Dechloromonas sp.]
MAHDRELIMTTIQRGFRNLGHAASGIAMLLAMTCGLAVAADIPLVDGTHWVKSTEEVKKAYLVGVSNVIQLEVAYQADNPTPEGRSLAPRAAKGMTGQTLSGVLESLDKWYGAHPEQLQRPVLETIWFEIVVPGLKTNK